MAFGGGAAASSSSSNQEYVLCGTDYLKVYKTTTADNRPEVSAAGLQSDEHKDTLRVEEEEQPPYVIVVQGPRKAKDTAAIDLTVKEEEPPYVIVVHGPPEVGKSLLIRSLVEHYAKENLNNVLYMQGPVTIISEKVFVDKSERSVSLLTERIAECKFKRRIFMGDTIFMRVQKEVEVPRFFNPVVPMPGLSDGPEEFRKGRRTVSFVEPSFRDLTIAKKFELDHCNKVEQKEFKKHPMLVISKEEEMLNEKREITKKHQLEPSVHWSPVGRVLQCARDLYGKKIPSFYTFVQPPHHIKSKN
ncbi:hypothetical protein MKW98_020175 [Papaver atlanticum]|uniref:Uncharacterized protein n=1 Tax=Papaver atlanticum TaxID=357466 RepID=A0AAD4XAJ9_9MAGN|nr:hypothetical protein MKW98_020175 [Papaver atlanticum]